MATSKTCSNSGRGRRPDADSGLARRPLLRGLGALLLTGAGVSAPRPASAARRPAVAAHRGGALLWPENSLTAFRGALGLGVDLVELDVHLTRDDEVVVLHDPTLDRTTTGRGPVRALAAGEVRALAVRGTEGEPPPLLREVLALLRPASAGLLLEIKVDAARVSYPGIEPAVLALLEASGLRARTTVMAFEWETLERLRTLAPGLRLTGLLSQRGADRWGGIDPAVARLRALGVDDLGIERTLLTPDAVTAAHAAGLTIGVWTVNEPEALRRALATDVDYVTTDRPDLALRLRGGG
jgi:glycerophosphoryl diester phosphodiesterase